MKKVLFSLVMLLVFAGCGMPTREYAAGTSYSTVTCIGNDESGTPVYVKEITISRVVADGLDTNDRIFVRSTENGVILSGKVSNTYPEGKVTVHNTTIL